MQKRPYKKISDCRFLRCIAGVILVLFAVIDVSGTAFCIEPPERRQPDLSGTTKKDKVFLEAANELEFNELIAPDFQILRGDVRFRKDSMYMFCDSPILSMLSEMSVWSKAILCLFSEMNCIMTGRRNWLVYGIMYE